MTARYARWLDELRMEIQEPQTPKLQRLLRADGARYVNALPATLRDGTTGAKVIWHDEPSGRTSSLVTVCRPDGTLAALDGNRVTAIRCGLLAALCLTRHIPLTERARIAIRGYGKIGRGVHEVLSALTAAYTVQVIPSPRQPAVEASDRLASFDAIITACAMRGDAPLDFDRSARTRAYIALDGNTSLGPTFRDWLPSYSDFPAQLREHWADEFPGEIPPALLEITDAPEEPAAYYCYGIGVADLIVARGLLWTA